MRDVNVGHEIPGVCSQIFESYLTNRAWGMQDMRMSVFKYVG